MAQATYITWVFQERECLVIVNCVLRGNEQNGFLSNLKKKHDWTISHATIYKKDSLKDREFEIQNVCYGQDNTYG